MKQRILVIWDRDPMVKPEMIYLGANIDSMLALARVTVAEKKQVPVMRVALKMTQDAHRWNVEIYGRVKGMVQLVEWEGMV